MNCTMKDFKQYLYLLPISILLFSSCEKEGKFGKDFEPQTYNVSGKVEKGPFISGTTITIQPMDGNLQVIGSLYSSTIQDDLGNFSFGSKLFEAPYAELTANGYFFNEVKGDLSSGTLNLRALVDLSDETTVNVNVLTHLKYQRIQNLIAAGMEFGEANRQSQEELFTAFGLPQYAEKDASSFSIMEGTDESAALIAISSLLLVDRSEAALTEYLAKLCREFGENGDFTESTKSQIAEDTKALSGRLPSIRKNIIRRYEELGLTVEVKELAPFFDWDNDGIAGNETLEAGEEVKLDIPELKVPNMGGTYNIHISSPIPVYLEPQVELQDSLPNSSVNEDVLFTNIYEYRINTDISLEKSIADRTLTLKIAPLNSKVSKSDSIQLYDFLGNVLGKIDISQEGNPNLTIPKLGRDGKNIVATIASNFAEAMSNLNLVEQYYHYNKEANLVNQYLYPSCSDIENTWSVFYRVIRYILTFEEAEYKQLGLYQDYFNVFHALFYYYLTVMWGDVPYIDNYDYYRSGSHNIPGTPQNKIFETAKVNLEAAITNLDKKRNESLNDENDFFFLSNDVVRILWANICMYQGDYNQAERLLKEVIDNGFYVLDSSNYNEIKTISDLWDNGSSQETIFATKIDKGMGTRSAITIGNPGVVSIMNYTDVILSYAECLYKNGKISEAKAQLDQVLSIKGIQVSGNNVLEEIKDARLQLTLYCNTNFAFLKRNNFAAEVYGVENYRLLLPIPESEILINPNLTQNPGY